LAIHLPFENVNLKYISKAEPDFRKKLAENWEKELRAGMTLYGPHRDDFACEIDGRSLYSFFSRGINRAVAFLIKLAQVNYLAKEPVLLLDDVFAELDSEMKKKMACALTQNMQVFYATVLEEDRRLFGASTALRVENGNIVA
jgi:DNA replication and repair protein RecF